MPDRFIRESICRSDTLNELSDFEERFWHRLIVNCDDYGRFDARPAVLKGALFPLMDGRTKKDMTEALDKLASVGLVELYEVGGKPFLHVVTWSKYQRTRAKASKFPPPPASADMCCQATSNVPVCECECEYDMRDSICDMRSSDAARARGANSPAAAAVMSAYRDRINPTPSQASLEELRGFAEEMGEECCQRAFDIALDAKKATWPYIRAILRDKRQQGVRCLADWDALEAERTQRKEETNGRGKDGKPPPEYRVGEWL